MSLRKLLCCALSIMAVACTTGVETSDPQAAAQGAMSEAMRSPEPPQPIPLPERRPATRLQSELGALSHVEIARWTLPAEHARHIVRTELLRGRMPRVNGIALYSKPVATAFAGVCEVERFDVWMRVPNETSLTYQQHLDPPLQPYQYSVSRKWRLVGSTVPDRRGGPPDCAAALPYGDWLEAPSAVAVHRAANLVEQAQFGTLRARLVCRQMRYEEARQDFGFPACPNPRALLERLTPNLIKRVRPADCEISAPARGCLGIEYHDPAAPGTHSFYLVTLPDEERPDYLQITQGMLPPH